MARRSQNRDDYDPSADPDADLDAATADAGWLLSSSNALLAQAAKPVSLANPTIPSLARAFRRAYGAARSTIRPIAFELHGLPLDECRIGKAVSPSCHEGVLKLALSVHAAIRVAMRRDTYDDDDIRDNWRPVAEALQSLRLHGRVDENRLDRRLQKENAMVARDRRLARLAQTPIRQPSAIRRRRRKLTEVGRMSVRIRDRIFPLSDPDAEALLRALAAAEGNWVTGPEISRKYLKGRKARFDRLRRKLPEEVNRLIEADAPKGYRLRKSPPA